MQCIDATYMQCIDATYMQCIDATAKFWLYLYSFVFPEQNESEQARTEPDNQQPTTESEPSLEVIICFSSLLKKFSLK